MALEYVSLLLQIIITSHRILSIIFKFRDPYINEYSYVILDLVGRLLIICNAYFCIMNNPMVHISKEMDHTVNVLK